MASFFNGLANFGQGAVQGFQDFRQKAQQIQQAQMQIDQQKKELAGQFAAFNNMQQGNTNFAPPSGGAGPAPAPAAPPQGPAGLSSVGPQQPPMAQPMPPGQSSAPAPQQPPMAEPAPAAPPSGAPAAPQGQPSPASPASASAQLDPNDPQAPIKLVMGVAQEIKARNPNIDPQTLFYATQNVIKMSSGIAPALRQQAILLGDQIRANTSMRNTDVREGGKNDRLTTTEGGKNKRLDKSLATRERIADRNASAAMQRVKFVQDQLNSRFSSGLGSKAQQAAVTDRMKSVTARLTAATRQLQTLKDAAGTPLPDTDPRVQKVKAEIDAANGDLDRIAAAAQIQPQAGSEAAPSNDDAASPSPASKPKAANTKPFTGPKNNSDKLPQDLPSPKGHAEGSVLKAGTKPIAKIVNGQWAPL